MSRIRIELASAPHIQMRATGQGKPDRVASIFDGPRARPDPIIQRTSAGGVAHDRDALSPTTGSGCRSDTAGPPELKSRSPATSSVSVSTSAS
jgi:hypothetical protein